MPRHILLLFFLMAPAVQAIVDSNNNGLSDVWEKQFNSGQLFPSSISASSDSDGDGQSNALEAIAGTNPFDAKPPHGIFQIAITHATQEPATNNPETFAIKWSSIAGKSYQLLANSGLSSSNWTSMGDPVTAIGNPLEFVVSPTQTNGSSPAKFFWRASVSDIDSDVDGLSNAEEHTLSTNPNRENTDGDTMSDLLEYKLGSDPRTAGLPPIQAFSEVREPNGHFTYTWVSFAEPGDWFRIEDKRPDGTIKVLYSTTYGSARLPFVAGSRFYTLTLDPNTDFAQ